MSFTLLTAVFVICIIGHNLEEFFLLPQWSASAGKWHVPVEPKEFRFAVVVLSLLVIFAGLLALFQGKQSPGSYLLCGYALAMLLNVFFPHVASTIALRRYAPGTATALLLNLPITIALLQKAITENWIDLKLFLVAGPLVIAGIAVLVPILFLAARLVLMTKK